MNKIQSFLEKHVSPLATKFASNRSINAISKGFTSILPITMVGAVASLLMYIDVFGFNQFLVDSGIIDHIKLVVALTTNAIAIYSLIMITYIKARYDYGESESRIITALSVMAFLLMTPLTDGNITAGWIGAKGLFVAMLCGLLIPTLYKLARKIIVIKLPDSVPTFVADSFNAIIPGILIAVVCCLVNVGCQAIGYASIHDLIYGILGKPFSVLQGSILVYLFTVLMMQVFWFFGIHGGSVLAGIQIALFMDATNANIAAGAAGQALPNMVTLGLATMVSSGVAYVSLCAILIFICKREDLKMLGKLAIVPAFFGISEPLKFGLPFVLNPTLCIPSIFMTTINAAAAYIGMAVGLVSRPRVGLLGNLPLFTDSFLVGGFSAVVLSVIMLVVNFLIWLPFVKAYENQKNKEDALLEK